MSPSNEISQSPYYASRWPAEDGGARRQQIPLSGVGLDVGDDEMLKATFRFEVAVTMAVQRNAGELFMLRHTLGEETNSWVERIDPETLEMLQTSPALPAGPMWPGGLAVAADGALLCVYGTFAHRLNPETLEIEAQRQLPRPRPYNSFVLLADGTLVTKDFAKDSDAPSAIMALDPVTLEPRCDEFVLPERSIARLSADGNTLYVVGTEHLWRLEWSDGWSLDEVFQPKYRTMEGQTYGWDAVLVDGAAWFLDNGEGTERFTGTFKNNGTSGAPLHLIRVDLGSGDVAMHEICGAPNGIIANPPAIDASRKIAIGFDSGNSTLTAFDYRDDGTANIRWQRTQDHAPHMIIYPDTGEIVTHDHDSERMAEQLVVLNIETGEERGRVDTGSPIQSPVFPAAGFGRDLYSCAFPGISRISVEAKS